MKEKRFLLIVGLVMCLFSTAFAQSEVEWKTDVIADESDPGLRFVAGGASTNEEYCKPCEARRLAAYKLQQSTRAQQTPVSAPASSEGTSQGVQ